MNNIIFHRAADCGYKGKKLREKAMNRRSEVVTEENKNRPYAHNKRSIVHAAPFLRPTFYSNSGGFMYGEAMVGVAALFGIAMHLAGYGCVH